ncbi:MAG TPA: DoxX family protein [Gemmatimonadales bacterium]
MTGDRIAAYRAIAQNALRIAAGLAFFSHGAQKMFGWFGGFGADGGTVDLMSRFGIAGTVEVTAGALIALGLFTRPAAFVASGEMAVAYFWMHWWRSGEMWWWENRGETVLLYSFIWLLFAAWGGGTFSLDAWLTKRKAAGPADAEG